MDIVDFFLGVFGICFAIAMILRKKKLEEIEDDIVKTRIVDTRQRTKGYSKVSTADAVKRAAIGGALFGKEGAEYGAATARRKIYQEDDSIVCFRVWWRDGSRTIEKVKSGSDRYDLFLQYLED